VKRFKLGHRWPVIVGVAAFVIVTVTRSDFGVDGSARNYLLSTISQSLAAVFALAFTITLVASQFAAKYSLAAVSDFFDARKPGETWGRYPVYRLQIRV